MHTRLVLIKINDIKIWLSEILLYALLKTKQKTNKARTKCNLVSRILPLHCMISNIPISLFNSLV